jgi:hypothetical protein
MIAHILKKILTGKDQDYKHEIPACAVYLKMIVNIQAIKLPYSHDESRARILRVARDHLRSGCCARLLVHYVVGPLRAQIIHNICL